MWRANSSHPTPPVKEHFAGTAHAYFFGAMIILLFTFFAIGTLLCALVNADQRGR